MSTFDKDCVEKPVLTEGSYVELSHNSFLGNLLRHQGAYICWTSDDKGLSVLLDMINKFVIDVRTNYITPGSNIYTKGVFSPDASELTIPPVLQEHKDRSFITLDCRGLRKGDALGFLHSLSQLPTNHKPIVIINHITDIPRAGSNIDNPEQVENHLLHSWHNDVIQLYDQNGIPFTMNPQNYTILIPIIKQKKTSINILRLRNNCYSQLQFDESLTSWMKNDFIDSLEYYVKLGRVSKYQETAVKDFINYHNR